MNTFRTYLRIVKAKPYNFVMYFAIFGIMLLVTVMAAGDTADDPNVALNYGVYVEGEITQETKDLFAYLNESGVVDHSFQSENDLRRAIFDHMQNFGFVVQKDGKLKAIQQGEPMVGMMARQNVEEYIGINRLLTEYRVPNAKDQAKELLNKHSVTEYIGPVQDRGSLWKLGIYFDFASYVTIMSLFMTMLTVSEVFQKKEFKTRTMISRTPYDEIQRQVLLGHMVLVGVLFFVIVALGIAITGTFVFTSRAAALMILNYGVFLVCIALFCFLIIRVLKKPNVGQMVANVIGLGTSFISGVFVPLDFLSPGVIKASQIFPTYWYVSANRALVNQMDGYWESQGVMLLMAGVLFVMIFVVDFRASRTAVAS